jgi:hypothetical protein
LISKRQSQMRYRLRTLLILLALGPPVLAWGYWAWPSEPEAADELRGFGLNRRPPRFRLTPEEQAAINVWINGLPASPGK